MFYNMLRSAGFSLSHLPGREGFFLKVIQQLTGKKPLFLLHVQSAGSAMIQQPWNTEGKGSCSGAQQLQLDDAGLLLGC